MAAPASPKPLPPGNLGPPLLGETLAIAQNNHQFYVDRFKKYGPVFKTRLFGKNVAVFVGPEAFSFFQNQPAFDRTGGNPPSVQHLMAHRSIALVDGPLHRARKRLMLAAFEPDALDSYVPAIEDVLARHVARWEGLGRFAWKTEFERVSGQLTAALYLGGATEDEAQTLNDLAERMRRGMTALPVDLRVNTFGRALASRDRLLALLDDAIARHRRQPLPGMLGRMTDAYDADPERTDDELRLDALHLMFANQGGIVVALTQLALVLGLYPEMRERARAEVQEHAAEGPLTLARLQRLDYLGRLSQEIRRFYPINSATFFAQVKETVEYGGYRIPAGWRAVAAIHAGMRHAGVFADGERFDPDRFLPDRAAALPENAYVPHGGGPREGHRCPAEDLITLLTKVAGVHLLRAHTWDFQPQDLDLDTSLFPLPREGLKVHFYRRAARPVAASAA